MSRYEDHQTIGAGGFCKVTKCCDKDSGRVFAKKVLVEIDPEVQERFRREVRILSKLDHPRIVKVVASQLTSPPLWYVMPLYKESLAAVLPTVIGEESRIRSIFSSVLEGMQYAHDQGIIHRDLKPANVLMNTDDDLVISDFGLGRALDSSTEQKTSTGKVFGTPGYMAPEQMIDAKTADMRADIFALGCILYELYANEGPPAVEDLQKLPPGIAAIVDRCIKQSPSKRFQSVGDLRRAFLNFMIASDRESGTAEVKSLVSKAIALGGLSPEDIVQFTAAINRCADDRELLHEVCVGLPQEAIVRGRVSVG